MKTLTLSSLCLMVLFSVNVFSESYKVKKLTLALSKTSDSEKMIDLFIGIANEIKGSNPDSALYYFGQAEKLIPEMSSDDEKEVIRVRLMLGRTSVEVAKGNYDEAWRLDSLALHSARSLKNPELEAQALMSKGGILYHLSEFDKAQEINHEALKINRTTADRKTEGKILTNMGTIEFMYGYAEKADSLFRIPLKLAEDAGDEDLLAASLVNIGLLNIYLGEYEFAEDYLLKSAEIYKTIDGKDGLVLCYQNLATIWFERGDMEKAIEFNTSNYNLSMELGDKTGLAKACQNLGECHSQIGDYEKALAYFIESTNIKIQLGDSKGIAATQSSIGHIHYLQEHFDQALEYYRKSLQTNIEIGYEMGIAGGYGNVGSIFNEQNQQDSALYYFGKSAGIYQNIEAINYLANVNLNIGKVYFARKDFKNAESFFSMAEEIKTQLDDKLGLYNTWSLMAQLYFEKSHKTKSQSPQENSDLNISLAYAKKAYDIALSNNILPGQRESAGILKDIYSALKNPEEALKFAQIKFDVSDSLNKKQRADALVNAEIRWKSERKQTEIDRLEREKSLQAEVILQKSALTNRLIIIIVVILLASALLIAASMLFVKNKDKQKAIEYQNHIIEITRLKMQNINNRLSPHLFFNLINSVSGEADNSENVKEKLHQVALLLRRSLENADRNAVTLTEELEMVKAYIELQGSRFDKTFDKDFQISDQVDMNIQIPPMIIQIPVENAIKHGLMPFEGEKKLMVTLEKSDHSLILKVADNGIGRKNSKGRTTGSGTGLKVLLQTIKILNRRNTGQITFAIKDVEPQGTEVEIHVPTEFNYTL